MALTLEQYASYLDTRDDAANARYATYIKFEEIPAAVVREAKRYLIDSIGFVAIDLGSLAKGGAMHQVGAPLSGLDLRFVRRLR